MAEVKYESKVSKATVQAAPIYAVLSDMRSLDKVRDLIPQDKVRDMEFEQDWARFKVDGLGQKITIRVVGREENKTIKLMTENSPMAITFWIQLKELALDDTRIKLTMSADLPMMFRMMLEKKLKEGLDQAADMLAQMPYEEWSKA